MGLLNRIRSSNKPASDDHKRRHVEAAGEAGDMLAVEAIDRGGLVVTREGALVRIIKITPPNPMILSLEDRMRVANTYTEIAGRLRTGQSLQFMVQARPVDLNEILNDSRKQVAEWAGPPPSPEHRPPNALAADRWRLYAAMEESLRDHSDEQAAMQIDAYVVCPYTPSEQSAAQILATVRPGRNKLVPSGSLERDLRTHQRAVRESYAFTDQVRSECEALDLPTRLLNGQEVVALLWSRFNPTAADHGKRPTSRTTEILGTLDSAVDAQEARQAATAARAAIAQSPLDFEADKFTAEVDRDLEQTIFANGTAENTHMGWLLNAMGTRQPFTLSVFVHALDRRTERTKIKRKHRREFAVNRASEARGRVPDIDRYGQEHESVQLLQEMSGSQRTNLYKMSIYMAIRARGPRPDTSDLVEAVDYCAEQIETSSDCKVSRGAYEQEDLWQSTLPLGRDIAGKVVKYAGRNVGDTIPLVGTSCGSPTGVPFAFSDPGRALTLINPFDRAHSNFTMLISGQSGSGKTMAANVIVSRCIAQGARGYILDRAGHYKVLTNLIEGARHISLGADDSEWAINPWDVADPFNVTGEKIAFLVSLHGVMMGEEGLTVLERSKLGEAIRGVYASSAMAGVSPRESMLRNELRVRAQEEQDAGAADMASVLRSLSDRIGEFCGDGSYAYLLDRETNVPADSPLVVFDTAKCPQIVLQPVMFAVVEFITNQVEQHKAAHRELTARHDAPLFAGRSILLIDEGWHMVGRKETGEFANDLARRARHLGLFFIVMSQQMSDFDTEYGRALLKNATMRLFLETPSGELAFVQEAVSLSDEETALIGRLKTIKGSHSQMFFMNGTRGKGQLALRISKTEYWAFTSEPTSDTPRRDERIAALGGNVWAAIHELASQSDMEQIAA